MAQLFWILAFCLISVILAYPAPEPTMADPGGEVFLATTPPPLTGLDKVKSYFEKLERLLGGTDQVIFATKTILFFINDFQNVPNPTYILKKVQKSNKGNPDPTLDTSSHNLHDAKDRSESANRVC